MREPSAVHAREISTSMQAISPTPFNCGIFVFVLVGRSREKDELLPRPNL